MPLIKCKECGNEVGSDATECPQCGKKVEKGTSCCFIGCLAMVIFAFIFLWAGPKNYNTNNSDIVVRRASHGVKNHEKKEFATTKELTKEKVTVPPKKNTSVFSDEQNSPESCVKYFYDRINQKDFQAAYKVRSNELRTKQSYDKWYKTYWDNNISLEVQKVEVLKNDGNKAEIKVGMISEDRNRQNGKVEKEQYFGKIFLNKTKGVWWIGDSEWKSEGNLVGHNDKKESDSKCRSWTDDEYVYLEGIISGDLEAVKKAYKNHPEVLKNDTHSALLNFTLTSAPAQHHDAEIEIAKFLIDSGANTNCGEGFRSPLFNAVFHGYEEIGELIIKKGADIYVKDGDIDLLSAASLGGCPKIVKYLINKGFKVNYRSSGGTALHSAASSGHLEIVKILIDNGAKVDSVNDTNGTALHRAAYHGHLEVVRILIDNGAKVDSVDNGFGTPLHCAAMRGHSKVVEYLISCGADVNSLVTCQTPLSWAARGGHKEVVEILLRSGADPYVTDNSPCNITSILFQEQQPVIAGILKKHGVRLQKKINWDY